MFRAFAFVTSAVLLSAWLPPCHSAESPLGQVADGKPARELAFVPSAEFKDQLAKSVDFSKEFVLIFKWSGSGQDKLVFRIEEGKTPSIVFGLIPGGTKDLRNHSRVYALAKNSTWTIPKDFPSPQKIEKLSDIK